MPSLRTLLLTNAAFSLASGALFAAAPETVDGWLETGEQTWLRVFGVVLILHAGLIVLLMNILGVKATAKINLVAIGGYFPLVIFLVGTGIIGSTSGKIIAIADAFLVEFIALGHAIKLFSGKSETEKTEPLVR